MSDNPHIPHTVLERLARIETKLDNVLEQKADQEIRIRWLERRLWVGMGGIGLISFFKEPLLKLFHVL